MSDRRVWLYVASANAAAVVFAVAAGAWGATIANILGALTIFVYLETFVAILWYTMETRRMQVGVTQQAGLIASSLRGTLYDSMRNAMMQINHLFISSPHLRPYFYDCTPFVRDEKDAANTKLYHELSSVADCMLDIFESVTQNMRAFPEEVPEYMEAWGSYMRSVFQTSPFLNAHFNRHPDWYVAELQRYRGQQDTPNQTLQQTGAARSLSGLHRSPSGPGC